MDRGRRTPLLLDGLDEVKAENREKCVEAINSFRDDHFVRLVVCCRLREYDDLTTQFKLGGAVLIQPLLISK